MRSVHSVSRPCPAGLKLLSLGAWLGLTALSSCYSLAVGDVGETAPPPESIAAVFAAQPEGRLVISAQDPGLDYRFDPSEKDVSYAESADAMRFRRVEIDLRDEMPEGTVLVDIDFLDGEGSKVNVGPVDLLRLTPKVDSCGDMQYPEMLLEEYERFGVNFRREHDEFEIALAGEADEETVDAASRAYRLGIWNNCLDATKWEMILYSEDYCDFDERLSGLLYINQQRTLSHNWFYMNAELYSALLTVKNPELEVDPGTGYEQLSDRAEEVVIDFDQLRTVRRSEPFELLEIGHQSARKLEPINPEQYYKWKFGLILNRDEFSSYRDVLSKPVLIAQFGDCGFYQPEAPKEFDFGWMRHVDDVVLDVLDVEGSDCYAQITLSGKDSPYKITLGNIDLALVDEQRFMGTAFGINPYPKTRRHNPKQDTIRYEAERIPDEIKPYLMLTRNDDGTWVNNQKIGLEKVQIGWESIDRDVLAIYVETYERIMPVWMARIRLSDGLVDRIRIRRRLYDY